MFIKKLYILALAVAAMGAVSCEDEADYAPASVPTNDQVYFPNNVRRAVQLEKGQTSFSVDVYRIGTSDAITVPVTATGSDAEVFVLPSSVTFAAGESRATMNVGVNFDKVQSGVAYTLDFTLDSGYTSEYGDALCSYSVEYFRKGDPLRDLVAGYYEGTSAGYDYWTRAWYATAFSYNYNDGANEALRILPGDGDADVSVRNLFPTTEYLNVTDVVGEVITSSDYEGYLGYILLKPQVVGSYTTQGGFGDFDVTFAAAWATGSYATAPTDDMEVWIAGTGSVADGTAEITSVDFNGAGWALMFGYDAWGMWYYAACGGAVVTPVK